MAANSFKLFYQQLNSAPDPLRVRVLQIIFDILMAHERDFLGGDNVCLSPLTLRIHSPSFSGSHDHQLAP